MKKIVLLLMFTLAGVQQAEAARGRQPSSGSKGGIAHCTSDGRFACNDGTLSRSTRFCSGYGSSEASSPVKRSTSPRKTQTKKVTTAKKHQQQRVTENDAAVDSKPRQPTCAPLYMASKPGFTHLPICSGNQY